MPQRSSRSGVNVMRTKEGYRMVRARRRPLKMILWLRMAALMAVALNPAWAQQPKFDIADIHNSTTLRTFALSFGGVVLDGVYINRDATMLDLIKDAYGVSDDDVAGGPGWISYDLFDIVAKVPAGTTGGNANPMLQSLLSDRFGLVVRRETSAGSGVTF